ncbi:MAG: glycosyltransferase family 39 protein [Acidobacteriota bacterium]|nr:glycosyltransferase family 39 protein [Acidobacteriota bacterium]
MANETELTQEYRVSSLGPPSAGTATIPADEGLAWRDAAPPRGRVGARAMTEGRPWTEWAGLTGLLAVTAVAYLWDLTASGYANSFYAAAVQAGTKSWKAFFFGSIDSSNFITVDKPPASLWVMELSGRLFGFSSASMLVPEALAGVATVALVYAAVRRWFGHRAALVAGVVMATTPVAALMFRFNNPDALLVLLLTASGYAVTRAVEKGRGRWLALAGAAVGLAFLAKMGQALLVVPAMTATYLLAAPVNLWRRLWHLLLAGTALVASAGWWVLIVTLWPESSRPLIDGSPTNSIWNLIVGYNGFSRVFATSGTGGGGGPGGGFSGSTGFLRLFNDLMGGQASWLLPAAAVALVVGLVVTRRRPRTDRTRAAIVLWGGWLIVTGAVFSFGQGVIHTYYTVALAPAIAVLIGVGAALVVRGWHHWATRVAAAGSVVVTTWWAYHLLLRTPTWNAWLRPVIVVGAALAVVGIAFGDSASIPARARRLVSAGTVGAVAVAGLAAPTAFAVDTIATAHTGSVPSAGPATSASLGGGPGSGGAGIPGGVAGGPPGAGAANFAGGAVPGAGGGVATSGGRPSGGTGAFSGASPSRGGAGPSGGTRVSGGAGLGGGAAGTGSTVSTALVKALEANASTYRWVAATNGSESAASLELASGGDPVMAIGGFNGQNATFTLATFEKYVAAGEIHYYIPGGGGGGPGGSGSSSAITSWVESHFKSETIGATTVYDLTSRNG